MLVLRRTEGQWVEITHQASGDTLRIRVYDLDRGGGRHVHLAFDDAPRHFAIERPERRARAVETKAVNGPNPA